MFPVNTIRFEIPGKTQPWQRRGVNTKTGRSYVQDETKDFKEWVRWMFKKAQNRKNCDWLYATRNPVKAEIEVFYTPPKDTPKWMIEAINSGNYVHVFKPDCDNLSKGILDALNKLAYHDDSQVFDLRVIKKYSDKKMAVVTLYEFNQPNSAKEWKTMKENGIMK